jgi:hypothetical protein
MLRLMADLESVIPLPAGNRLYKKTRLAAGLDFLFVGYAIRPNPPVKR